jgi:nicotinamide-nucleotide amidase
MVEVEVEIARLIREYRAKTGEFLTIGTVESATGGRIADRITNVAGSSDYFKGSVVAYSNEAKIALLGVKKATIENHGVVSAQTAEEMAQGGRKLLDVDVCVSDTGIAGPSGGTPRKPVGLFYLGLAAGNEVFSQKHNFLGNREENKRDAVKAVLNMLKQYLLRHFKAKDVVRAFRLEQHNRQESHHNI